MRLLSRYLASLFLKSFFGASLGLATLFVFQGILTKLLEGDFPLPQIVFFNLMLFPEVFVQMTPPGVMIATLITLSTLNRTNELVACYSIGIGLKTIVGVLLSLVFMISSLSLSLQDRILPPVFKKRNTYYWHTMKKRPDFYLDVKQDKIWYRSKNLIYNLRTFDPKLQRIYGMSVYTFDRNFDLVQIVHAKEARYEELKWRLSDGTITIFDEADRFPLTKKFSDQALDIQEKPSDFEEIEREVDSLRIRELWRYIGKIREAGADTKIYEVKLWSKISQSFIPLVMCVLAVPFSVRRRREGGIAKDMGICLAITFFYWLLYSLGLSLGSNGALPPILAAALPSLLFAALAAFLITRKRV
jgi:lipopolysaccharide export system permease protein